MGEKYTHILVALDFSDSDASVLARGTQLAQQNAASLTLVHVLEPTPLVPLDEIPPLEAVELNELKERRARANLEALQEKIKPLEAQVRLEVGMPKHQMVRLAREVGADLIVIGSHGRHGIQLLLGSTANGVLHLAECDVLAVRVK